MSEPNLSALIWSVADLLRGDYKQSDYGPFKRHFYVFKPPRPLAEFKAELRGVTDRIIEMIGGMSK